MMPRTRYWGAGTHEPAIQRGADPYIRLGFAVLKKAAVELKEKDMLEALPALLFWLEDGPGWLEMLELSDPSDDQYFCKLVEGCHGKKRTASRFIGKGNQPAG